MKGFEIELCLMIVSLKVYEILDSEMQKSLQRISLYTIPEISSSSLHWWIGSSAFTLWLSSVLPGRGEIFHAILFWHYFCIYFWI